MLIFDVLAHVRGVVEFLLAVFAFIWFLSKMERNNVTLHVALAREVLVAEFTSMWLLLEVSCLMCNEVVPLRKRLSAMTPMRMVHTVGTAAIARGAAAAVVRRWRGRRRRCGFTTIGRSTAVRRRGRRRRRSRGRRHVSCHRPMVGVDWRTRASDCTGVRADAVGKWNGRRGVRGARAWTVDFPDDWATGVVLGHVHAQVTRRRRLGW